jgi:hypothetical protein
MDKFKEPSAKKTALHFVLLLVCLGLSACTYVGRTVPADNRILFSRLETGQGVFQQGVLTINYNYALIGGNVSVSGQVIYRSPVGSLDVYLLFINGTGTVVQQKLLYSSGYRVSRYWAGGYFDKTFTVPPGATAISFNHSIQPHRGNK